jgi:AcrR family transcriptional regulator
LPRPRTIDRDKVLRCALLIADEHGLAAVTMGAVAQRLGVTPMALYRPVRNKDDLLDGLVELLLGELPEPDAAAPWPAQLLGLAHGLRDVARRHPAVFPLLLHRPAATPDARRVRAAVLQVLRVAGVADEHLDRLERILTTAAIGLAAGEVSARFAGHARGSLDEDFRALAVLVEAGIQPFRTALPGPPQE